MADAWGQVWGHGISTCSPAWELWNPVLLGFYGGFITMAWLIKPLALGDWTHSLAPLSILEVEG